MQGQSVSGCKGVIVRVALKSAPDVHGGTSGADTDVEMRVGDLPFVFPALCLSIIVSTFSTEQRISCSCTV